MSAHISILLRLQAAVTAKVRPASGNRKAKVLQQHTSEAGGRKTHSSTSTNTSLVTRLRRALYEKEGQLKQANKHNAELRAQVVNLLKQLSDSKVHKAELQQHSQQEAHNPASSAAAKAGHDDDDACLQSSTSAGVITGDASGVPQRHPARASPAPLRLLGGHPVRAVGC